MQVGADGVAGDRALQARVAVVAVTAKDAAEGLLGGAEPGVPGVVLEARQDAATPESLWAAKLRNSPGLRKEVRREEEQLAKRQASMAEAAAKAAERALPPEERARRLVAEAQQAMAEVELALTAAGGEGLRSVPGGIETSIGR